MLMMEAIAPEDAWAIVRTDAGLQVLRPPYGDDCLAPVTEDAVGHALVACGFVAERREFAGWDELIAYLEERVAAARPELAGISSVDLARRFLQVASVEDLRDALDYVKDELLPQQQWRHAWDLLLDVLRVPSDRSNDDITESATELLRQALKGEDAKKSEERDRLLAARRASPSQFPHAERACGSPQPFQDYTVKVADGRVLEMVA